MANAVEGIRNVVLAFKAVGAQTVLVPNIPNLGVVPSITRFGPGVSAFATLLSNQFNAALDAMLDGITGVNIVRFDTFGFVTDVVTNPAKYGFTNATQPCYSGFVEPNPSGTECSNPDGYVFWDVLHPTRKLHEVLAEQLFSSVLQCQAIGRNEAVGQSGDSDTGPGFLAKCTVNVHAN